MCAGVTSGFAGVKLSGSMKKNGILKLVRMNAMKISSILVRSFMRKYGWNGILSVLFCIPRGFDDLFSCRKTKCMMTSNKIMNGKR
jgi:hypothetical protein